ncbi:putative ubiE/COQ5 methyltransferase [Meredithblackwellia eburnea MCA 4105]
MSESKKEAAYTHGHVPSVLRSHSWRTAQNSAGFLLPHLEPHFHILDVGCGPGTISVDLAKLVPQGKVTGLEYAAEVLVTASKNAEEKGVKNIEWVTGDVHKLTYPDNTFDVVYAHQVLQHVTDPVQALREMYRVVKPGGIVAVRDSDFAAFLWYPSPLPGMDNWLQLYLKVAKNNGGEPLAGRHLHAWARQVGFSPDKMKRTAGTWCYSTPEEVAWWSDLWAERTLKSSFRDTALKAGLATEEELKEVSESWRDWGKREDAWFTVVHGEVLAWK